MFSRPSALRSISNGSVGTSPSRGFRRLGVSAFVACTLIGTLTGCAVNPGRTVETPSIPAVAAKGEARARLGSYLAIEGVEDRRDSSTASNEGFTEPFGRVGSSVEEGIKSAFRENGISILETAPVTLHAEVRKWRTKVGSGAQTMLDSEATVYVELKDPSGKRLFSGSYNGTRSSQFPVVTRVDVQDSLALAMANAIGQIVSDPGLLNVLSSY